VETTAKLYLAYQGWATSQGFGERERDRLTLNAFGRRMGGRFKKARASGVRVYNGVRLRVPQQPHS
jgi:hypothetical protein